MNELPKDILQLIAFELNLPDVLKFCKSGKRINQKVCKEEDFWRNKLLKDYPDYENYQFEKSSSFKEIYQKLYDLQNLAEEWGGPMFNFYNFKVLDLVLDGKVPKEIGVLQNLEELNMYGNVLKELPKEIGKLTNLRKLNLDNNLLEELPKEIGKLTNLKVLHLVSNKLKKLPKEIGKLTNLVELLLSVNELKELPKEFENLENLRYLDLTYNQLEEFPKEIIDLPNLETLGILKGNRIQKIPEEAYFDFF